MTSDIPAFPPIQDALGALLAGRDWTTTPLGHPDRWPAVVRSTLATWLDSPQPMCMAWGADLRFFFNAAYAPMLGARVGSAMGQPFREVWPDVWADIEPIVERALAGVGSRFDEMPLTMTRNGYPEETWWTFTYQPLRDEEARVVGMLCTTTDVTAQVLGRRQAMRERERQQRLLQQMPGFVAVTTGPGHVFAYVNDAFRRIAGERDFIGGTVREIFPELASQGFYEMIDAVYATGRPNVVRSHPLRLSGDAQDRYIDLLCQPTFDETGAIHGLFCGGYEVTEGVTATAGLRRLNETLEQRVEERTADLMRAQDALRQSQKLEAVGQLTGGIAHDFNNLLTVIQGNLQVLQELPELVHDAQARQLLGAATRASRRGAELTGKLLAFSRRQVLQPVAVDTQALLHSLAGMLRRTLDQRIRIEIEAAPQRLHVRADPGQLESALLNIAINARDAMPE
ncbi:MAG TPA: PAS domain-containing protein, partial [Variovorax sp.]|nr:PAS domain-containing protein [Variovorax sp.]